MKVFTTIVGVTKISVQPGKSSKAGEPTRDIVITGPDGDVTIRLVGQNRADLQVTFAPGQNSGEKGGEHRGLSAALKEQVLG